MKIESALRRINLLILMLVMGLPGAAPPAMAQEQSCYRLVKAETRADLPKEEDLLWFQKYTDIQRLADGSILAISRSARYVYSWQVWPGETRAHYEYKMDGQLVHASDFTWIAPPQTWCTGQSAELGGSIVGSQHSRLFYRMLPVDSVTAAGEPTGMDPLKGIEILERGERVRKAGTISTKLRTQTDDSWTLFVWVDGGGGDTMSINYHYELVPSGQEQSPGGYPPPGGTGTDTGRTGTGTGGTGTGTGGTGTDTGGTGTDTGRTGTGSGGTGTGTGGTGTGPGGAGSATGGAGTGNVPGGDLPTPSFGSPEPATVGRMTIQAGQRKVVEGQLVNVPVWLIKGADVANINFTVGYNASVATPEGDPIKGNLLDNALFSANTGDTGLIRAGFAQTSGINGTGTVAYMPFRAVGKPGDRTVLDVGVSTINNPGGTVLAIDRIDGEILIVGPDGVVPGDCDGDGSLTELDALCALQMSVQLIPERLALDLDTDSQVTSRDSVIILQRAIGK